MLGRVPGELGRYPAWDTFMIQFRKQNIWFNEPILEPSEQILFEIPANHTQGRRAVGGKLFATTARFLFIPNRMDSFMGGSTLEIQADQVAKISARPPNYSLGGLFSGAFRSRLAISTESMQEHRFVVKQLDKTIQKLGELKLG